MYHTNINKKPLRPIDRLGYIIATGAGAGSAPVAPGTFGAAEGVVLFLIINALVNNTFKLTPLWSLLSFAVINIALYAIGVWAAGRAIDVTETKDPSVVVIDEVSGQLIALTPVIIASWLGRDQLAGILVAFVLFRFFDILKPPPIRWFERRYHGGFGVMLDDLLAAGYTLLNGEHVKIDVISSRLSKRKQIWIDVIGFAFFLTPMCMAVLWFGIPFFLQGFRSGEVSSNAGGLIRWPVYLLMPTGFALLLLQGLSEFIKRIAFLRGLIPDPTEKKVAKTAEEELAEELRRQAEAQGRV
jgi:TRAP-type mannitol/chloroaromatic compound transport system permease small subunit